MSTQELFGHRQFERQLLRERALADRMHTQFVLLVFALPSVEDRKSLASMMTLLGQTICRRIRMSDLAGWYGPGHERIGILLHATAQDDVNRLIDQIEKAFQERVRELGVRLYAAAQSDVRGLIEDIEKAFHARVRQKSDEKVDPPELVCEVFTYPGKPAVHPGPAPHHRSAASRA